MLYLFVHKAQEVHAQLRTWLADNTSAAVAKKTRIIYGGEHFDYHGCFFNQVIRNPFSHKGNKQGFHGPENTML